MEIVREASELLIRIKESRPLIHHITNYVTMNDSANIVLAVGASPIMANDPAEAAEAAVLAKALVLNMGTPSDNNFRSMLSAGKKANELSIPIIFDPVGAGFTSFRRKMCEKLLAEIKPAVIKGNISEIRYLAGMGNCSCGVDSFSDIDNVKGIVQTLAKDLKCVAAATGKNDMVSDGSTTYIISNGHEMLTRITGTGCMTSSLIGAFCSVTGDYLAGTAAGIMSMGISGQLAFRSLLPGEGIGMFKVKLLDCINNLSAEALVREGEVYAV